MNGQVTPWLPRTVVALTIVVMIGAALGMFVF